MPPSHRLHTVVRLFVGRETYVWRTNFSSLYFLYFGGLSFFVVYNLTRLFHHYRLGFLFVYIFYFTMKKVGANELRSYVRSFARSSVFFLFLSCKNLLFHVSSRRQNATSIIYKSRQGVRIKQDFGTAVVAAFVIHAHPSRRPCCLKRWSNTMNLAPLTRYEELKPASTVERAHLFIALDSMYLCGDKNHCFNLNRVFFKSTGI